MTIYKHAIESMGSSRISTTVYPLSKNSLKLQARVSEASESNFFCKDSIHISITG